LSSSDTVFISGKDLVAYVRSLETEQVKVQEIDFLALKSEVPNPAPAAAKSPVKAPSKAEASIQIAIGAKKDGDFSAWYTDVRPMISRDFTLTCSFRFC
jgi:prolyl-tRNA synthetase